MVGHGAGPDHLLHGGDVKKTASTWRAMELFLTTCCMVRLLNSICMVGHGAGPGNLLYGGVVEQHLQYMVSQEAGPGHLI